MAHVGQEGAALGLACGLGSLAGGDKSAAWLALRSAMSRALSSMTVSPVMGSRMGPRVQRMPAGAGQRLQLDILAAGLAPLHAGQRMPAASCQWAKRTAEFAARAGGGGVSPKVSAAAGFAHQQLATLQREDGDARGRVLQCLHNRAAWTGRRHPPSESAANSMTWRRSGVRMPRETSITEVGSPLG